MCCVAQTDANSGIAPSIVAANWRDQFNNDPILSKFATATLEISVNSGVAWSTPSDAQENAIYAGGATGVQNLLKIGSLLNLSYYFNFKWRLGSK